MDYTGRSSMEISRHQYFSAAQHQTPWYHGCPSSNTLPFGAYGGDPYGSNNRGYTNYHSGYQQQFNQSYSHYAYQPSVFTNSFSQSFPQYAYTSGAYNNQSSMRSYASRPEYQTYPNAAYSHTTAPPNDPYNFPFYSGEGNCEQQKELYVGPVLSITMEMQHGEGSALMEGRWLNSIQQVEGKEGKKQNEHQMFDRMPINEELKSFDNLASLSLDQIENDAIDFSNHVQKVFDEMPTGDIVGQFVSENLIVEDKQLERRSIADAEPKSKVFRIPELSPEKERWEETKSLKGKECPAFERPIVSPPNNNELDLQNESVDNVYNFTFDANNSGDEELANVDAEMEIEQHELIGGGKKCATSEIGLVFGTPKAFEEAARFLDSCNCVPKATILPGRELNELILGNGVNLGGCTSEVPILEVRDGVLEVLSNYSDTPLGGGDFDKRDDRIVANIKRGKATTDGPEHIRTTLIRAKFEELCSKQLGRFLTRSEIAVRDAKLSFSNAHEVILDDGDEMPQLMSNENGWSGEAGDSEWGNDRVISISCLVNEKQDAEVDEEFNEKKPLCIFQDTLHQGPTEIANAWATTGEPDKKWKGKEECQPLNLSSQSLNTIGEFGATIKKFRRQDSFLLDFSKAIINFACIVFGELCMMDLLVPQKEVSWGKKKRLLPYVSDLTMELLSLSQELPDGGKLAEGINIFAKKISNSTYEIASDHYAVLAGSNCGPDKLFSEVGNLGIPLWLIIVKEVATCRATVSYLPMFSHQKPPVSLIILFVSSVPRFLLPRLLFLDTAGVCPCFSKGGRKHKGYFQVSRTIYTIDGLVSLIVIVLFICEHKKFKKATRGVIISAWKSIHDLVIIQYHLLNCLVEANAIRNGARGRVCITVLSNVESVGGMFQVLLFISKDEDLEEMREDHALSNYIMKTAEQLVKEKGEAVTWLKADETNIFYQNLFAPIFANFKYKLVLEATSGHLYILGCMFLLVMVDHSQFPFDPGGIISLRTRKFLKGESNVTRVTGLSCGWCTVGSRSGTLELVG